MNVNLILDTDLVSANFDPSKQSRLSPFYDKLLRTDRFQEDFWSIWRTRNNQLDSLVYLVKGISEIIRFNLYVVGSSEKDENIFKYLYIQWNSFFEKKNYDDDKISP